MTGNQDIFDKAFKQLKKQLPFVVFRKPNEETIRFIGQSDKLLNYSSSFDEEGFVFTPFSNLDKTVIIKPEVYFESNYIDDSESKGLSYIVKEVNLSGKEAHVKLVSEGIKAIKGGEFKKVVLSRSEMIKLEKPSYLSIFKKLLGVYKTAFAYWWYHPEVGMWMGASPEILALVNDSYFETMSLAGTQKFEGDMNVSWGEKELMEQQIVTDYIAENLSDVSETLSVLGVETTRAGSLLHLKTEISGVFKKDAKLRNLIEALHPTPAVCGYPKMLAKEFILKNEHYERGYYTGFLGYINGNGASLYVNLRCMQLKEDKAIVYIGGGVTKDSDPEAEWEETLNKSQTMMRLL